MSAAAIQALINSIGDEIINPLILLLFSWAFLVFLWGIFEFVYKADDDKARTDGKKHILWGIVGMVIMVAAVGITYIIKATVNSF